MFSLTEASDCVKHYMLTCCVFLTIPGQSRATTHVSDGAHHTSSLNLSPPNLDMDEVDSKGLWFIVLLCSLSEKSGCP